MAVNSEKFRVLLLSDSRAFHTERFAEQLVSQGCEVLTASLEYGSMPHVKLAWRGPVKSLHYVLAVPRVKRLLSDFKPDVINPHFASGYGFIAALAGRNGTVPIVLNLWGSDVLIVPKKSFPHRWKTAYALRAAECVIGDSEYLVNAAGSITPLRNSEVIPWGIEREFLSLHKSDYGFHKPLRIIVPRTQAPVYNNEFIVRALRPLIADGRVRLTFPSFGELADSFHRLVSKFSGLGVELYDRLPRARFLKMMSEHDVYLSASRSDSSPASLIEAMALGLFPVVAEIPGVREWLSNENGKFFTQDSEDGLLEAVSSLIDAEHEFTQIRQMNLERVKQTAIFENNVARQIEIMREVARERLQ